MDGAVVYFLYSAGLIKIGHTTALERRLIELQSMAAAPTVLVAILPGDKNFEISLHRIFKSDRRHGEWFYPSPELRRFLECIDAAASVIMPPEQYAKAGRCIDRLYDAEQASPITKGN